MAQETLEEAAERILWNNTGMLIKNHPTITQLMIDLAKWQQERMLEIMDAYAYDVMGGCTLNAKEWLEQHKK